MTRQIVLDTETTGLDPQQGHRIIEIGCVELIKRRPTRNTFHSYLNPDREIDEGALEVHGITQDFLADKPRFGDIAESLVDFIKGAELVIHNAEFDVGFVNHELSLLEADFQPIESYCDILDTLTLARKIHPGQRNSLDALCKRYQIDNSKRTLHGALLDAQILLDVYLAMTGGQKSLLMDFEEEAATHREIKASSIETKSNRKPTRVIYANQEELDAHEKWLELLDKEAENGCVWRRVIESND